MIIRQKVPHDQHLAQHLHSANPQDLDPSQHQAATVLIKTDSAGSRGTEEAQVLMRLRSGVQVRRRT